MKFFRFFKSNPSIEVGTISDKELVLLATMCQKCDPKVVKKSIITRCYAYYVPQHESFLESAKEIFIRNGIPMQEHWSNIMEDYEQKVLRTDYSNVKNPDILKQEMKRIKAKLDSMYETGKWLEKQELQKQIQELKEKQR